jgi:uncharacterized protein with ParB-like and HNH nuclease domain
MADQRRFLSALITISSLSERSFVIPTYQRPYVWEVEQIEKLLSDALQAYRTDPLAPYFIGTVLTEEREKAFELIDGQQRFTTLWMVAAILHELNVKTDMTGFLRLGKSLRIDFEIRSEVRDYFELLADFPLQAVSRYSEKDIQGRPYLMNITAGLATIRSWMEGHANLKGENCLDLAHFGNYLFNQLIMVENLAPDNIDLNKLFATINSSGIQLEQTDIVKSKLLKRMTDNKVLYSKIWEACENMSDYFERNVRKIFSHTSWSLLKTSDFAHFDQAVFLYSDTGGTNDSGQKATISSIFNGTAPVNEAASPAEQKEHNGYCRSIISFSQLLIHAYRIHLFRKGNKDFGQSFHSDKLIGIFDELLGAEKEDIADFFKLLWELRFTFDKYIIKWTADLDSKQEYLELSRVSKNDKHYFGRNIIEKSASQMLQSVLYFTGDYLRQYWLTPFLHHLTTFPQESTGAGSAKVLELLESVDNVLSLSTATDRQASFGLMKAIPKAEFNRGEYLKEDLGTGFYRYWFQKLEYILWKGWEDRGGERFKAFRITSKNSIEHIFPQNPEYRDQMEKKSLDSFGNLVLLSVSQNSEYGRKQVNVKRAEFEGKRTYDSLKSKVIFSSYDHGESWDEGKISLHCQTMIGLIAGHYRGELETPLEVVGSLEMIDNDDHID